jgi:GNAT superfamily N-acetyltransferase
MTREFHLRLAARDDVPRLHELIALSVRGLMQGYYSSAQLESSLGNWLGLDTRLIDDGTYFVVEPAAEQLLVGCGGWSRRKTPYGSDHRAGREDALLDPRTEPAKIRAFFVHPDWSRRGIGAMLLDASESAARAAGFTNLEMGATLSGVPMYERFGYLPGERVELPLEGGESLPILKMYKRI